MKVIILLLLFIPASILSQWSWINPTPQGNYINHLIYTGSQRLVAIGDYGTITISTNDGTNWSIIYRAEGNGDNFTSYSKLNENTYLLGTNTGNIYKTTNAGNNIFHLSNVQNLSINAIAYSSGQIIYALAGISNSSCSDKILKSTDGGVNWFLSLQVNANYCLFDMVFINENTGFAGGGIVVDKYNGLMISQLFRTTNGGLNWIEYSYPGDIGPIKKFSFPNSSTGYASGWGEIIKTTNSGLNWTPLDLVTGDWINSLVFINELTGFAGEYNELFKTTNAGVNWTTFNLAPYCWAFNTGYVQSINVVNSNVLYVSCSRHIIIKSTNSGTNWTSLTSGYYEPQKSIFFTNQSTGYLGGWSNKIRKTTNGGLNWIETLLPFSTYVEGIYFTDVNTGYGVGGNSGKGVIFKTTNAGVNWVRTDSMGSGTHRSVLFINSSTGFVLGDQGEIWRTSNNGSNWIQYNSGVQYRLYSICFPDDITGYACGGDLPSKVIKTTNSGLNWVDVYSAPSTQMFKIKFANNLTGYVCGTGIRKTTDGGSTWTQIFPRSPVPRVMDIWLVNSSLLYVSVQYGKFYKSTDAGNTWNFAYLPMNYFSSTLYFLDQNTGFLLSDQGTLLRTTNGGGPVGVNNINTEIPKEFSLSQNYPNPFNPSTTIEFDIPEKSFVSLFLYDVTGRLVEVLANELMSPGRYRVSWNGTNYSSGVYFYTLKTESFQQTKRMVLVK
jgi:photosystem II stability/assembly factor-like uncharacterized protein